MDERRHHPAIALLGIYPEDTDVMKQWDTCTPILMVATSAIAKLWKEPQCPSTDEWIKKMWFIYTMEYHSAIRDRTNHWHTQQHRCVSK